jgi:hypothetical protein
MLLAGLKWGMFASYVWNKFGIAGKVYQGLTIPNCVREAPVSKLGRVTDCSVFLHSFPLSLQVTAKVIPQDSQ